MIYGFFDKLFKLCGEQEKFGEYITGIKDLKPYPQKEIITFNFERLIMDSLYISPSLDCLVNIEHQSQISNQIMFRNLKYYVTTKDKHKMKVMQFIFYTGKKEARKWYAFDKQVFHQPYMKQTCLYDGLETFNCIKNILNNNQKLSPFDIFDLIWLPCFRKIEINDEFLKEYMDVISKLKDYENFDFLVCVAFGWVKKLNSNDEIMKYYEEKFKMVLIDSPEFEDFMATAVNEKEIAKKDQIINEQYKKIAQKDEKIAEKDEKIAQKDEKIAQKDEKIAEKDKIIRELKNELKKTKIVKE